MARRTIGVRVRTATISAAVVGVTLVTTLLAVGFTTRARLTAAAQDRALARVEAVAAQVEAGAVSDPLPGRNPDLLAQVIAPDGTVVAADRAAAGLAPFSTLQPGPAETTVIRVDAPDGIIDDDGLPEQGPWLLAVRGTATGEVVIAGTPLDEAADVFGAAALGAGLGLVVVIVVAAAATWVLTGWALRPVDRMRREAERISAGALNRRLAVPPTGDEIARLGASLNAMLGRLEEAAAARREFVADASHELRSPVAAMRSMLDVTGPDPADPELLSALGAEVHRMERLVDDLLVLARSDARPATPTTEVDLDQVLRQEAAAARRRSPLPIDTTGIGPARVLADPDAMARMIRNLVDNALRHAAGGVWLLARTAGDRVVIGVDDDGPGIDPADRERVFERLVRLDTARDRASGGSGLGLSVVRAIARGAGGEARFVDPRRGGASAEVWLPSS